MASFEYQTVTWITAKYLQKSAGNIWSICCKAVILHPLSREKRGGNEILNKDGVLDLAALKKIFSKKKLQKVLVVQKKALPLHPLSERKP